MKYIVMPDNTADLIISKMTEKVRDILTKDRNIGAFTFNFKPEDLLGKETIYLDFSPMAYLKQHILVANQKDEIGWHGITRVSEDRKHFYVDDILVYPQATSAATVTVDEATYQTWKNALPDEQYNNLRYQAHSHVNMGVSPSGVDTTLYNAMLSSLGGQSYYIFLITNKQGLFWINIYDIPNNRIYDKEDIKIRIDGVDLNEWQKQQIDQFIKPRTFATPVSTINPAYEKKTTGNRKTPTSKLTGQKSTDQASTSKFSYKAPYEDAVDSSAEEADALVRKYEQMRKTQKINYPIYCVGCENAKKYNPKRLPCKTCVVMDCL